MVFISVPREKPTGSAFHRLRLARRHLKGAHQEGRHVVAKADDRTIVGFVLPRILSFAAGRRIRSVPVMARSARRLGLVGGGGLRPASFPGWSGVSGRLLAARTRARRLAG